MTCTTNENDTGQRKAAHPLAPREKPAGPRGKVNCLSSAKQRLARSRKSAMELRIVAQAPDQAMIADIYKGMTGKVPRNQFRSSIPVQTLLK